MIHKPPGLWLVITHQVVMQPRFMVDILVLQAEGLVCARDADLVAVVVVGLLAAFAVGQFAVDQVAGAVVVIGRAVVGFKAVEYVVGKAVARTVFICDS